MAALDYAASLIMDEMLDIETTGANDALAAFEDYSDEAVKGQSITVAELGNITVSASGANGQTASALNVNTAKLVVDQPAYASFYIQAIEDVLGMNGGGAKKAGAALYRRLRAYVAGQIINAARENLIGSGDTGLVANAGADALTDNDVSAAEAMLCDSAGVGQDTPLVLVGSSGFTAACKSLANYQPPTSAVGVGRLEYVNGRPYFQTSALETRAGKLSAVISDSVVSASNTVVQTVPSGHHFVRGGLVTTAGLTVDASVATAITATSATSVTHALTASAGQQADHAGTLNSASSIGLLFVKPWSCFALANGAFRIRIVDAADGPGYVVQCFGWYGSLVRAGGVAAIHAPLIG